MDLFNLYELKRPLGTNHNKMCHNRRKHTHTFGNNFEKENIVFKLRYAFLHYNNCIFASLTFKCGLQY